MVEQGDLERDVADRTGLRMVGREGEDGDLTPEVVVVQAIPKGDRGELAVELGRADRAGTGCPS